MLCLHNNYPDDRKLKRGQFYKHRTLEGRIGYFFAIKTFNSSLEDSKEEVPNIMFETTNQDIPKQMIGKTVKSINTVKTMKDNIYYKIVNIAELKKSPQPARVGKTA